MNVHQKIAEVEQAQPRIVGRHYGKSLLGPEFDIALGDRYFRIGALTLRLLEKGTPASDLDMLEIDLDAESEEY